MRTTVHVIIRYRVPDAVAPPIAPDFARARARDAGEEGAYDLVEREI